MKCYQVRLILKKQLRTEWRRNVRIEKEIHTARKERDEMKKERDETQFLLACHLTLWEGLPDKCRLKKCGEKEVPTKEIEPVQIKKEKEVEWPDYAPDLAKWIVKENPAAPEIVKAHANHAEKDEEYLPGLEKWFTSTKVAPYCPEYVPITPPPDQDYSPTSPDYSPYSPYSPTNPPMEAPMEPDDDDYEDHDFSADADPVDLVGRHYR